MHPLKKLFQSATGYWLHKAETLPPGTNLLIDIQRKIRYPLPAVIFDVGANTGQTVAWLRDFLPDATIYSFEPVASTFKELKRNVSQDKKVLAAQLAFGDREEKKMIRVFEQHSALNSLKAELMNQSVHAKEEEITVTTIDSYCKTHTISKIDFLKIDTEGYELKVLEGASKMLLEKRVSLIYCEVGFQQNNKRNTPLASLIEWLEPYDYYFFGLYQLVSDGWKDGHYFGNALFVQKEAFNC